MEVILYTCLILNLLIGYCVMQDGTPGNNDDIPVAGDTERTTEDGKYDSNEFRRYMVEENFRYPIFGSYKYDPLKQQFETEPDTEDPAKDGISTLAGDDGSSTPLADGETASTDATPAPEPAADTPAPADQTKPEAKKLRERLNSMHGGNSGKAPASHWWARAKPLPSDAKSGNSTNGNSI